MPHPILILMLTLSNSIRTYRLHIMCVHFRFYWSEEQIYILLHNLFHIFLVFGRDGACLRCAIFRAGSDLHVANHCSQFTCFPRRNIAYDLVTIHVYVGRFQWWWTPFRSGISWSSQQSEFEFIWCDLPNLWKEHRWTR